MARADELARFQTTLLDLLSREVPTDEIQRRLHEDTAFAEFRAYVDRFEPRMLAVAAELVKKWGKRSESTPDASA
jgi:hypothetical protein